MHPDGQRIRLLLQPLQWPSLGFVWVCLCALFFVACPSPKATGPGPAVAIWPRSGNIQPGTEISLSSQRGVQIYYTLDETPPSASNGYLYKGAFGLWGSSVIRYVAVDADGRVGPAGKASFFLDLFPPLSNILPPPGNQGEPIAISFETNADAKVYYTVDGSSPSTQSRLYQKPFVISKDTKIRFFSIDASGNRERVRQAIYNFAPKLTATPPGGLYHIDPDDPSRAALKIVASSNEDSLIQYRFLVPPGPWRALEAPISLTQDVRLQIVSTDLAGLSTSLLREYGIVLPIREREAKVPLQGVLVAAFVDVEGLGQPRLIAATKEALWTVVRKDGEWSTPTRLATLDFAAQWIRIWDLDGDGLSDIMIGDQEGGLRIFQTLAATLVKVSPGLLGSWTPKAQLRDIVPIDIDANGQLDVLLLDQREGQSRISRRSKDGYLLPASILPPIAAGATGALAGDFDQDGDPDLLILPGAKRIPYLLANKEGSARMEKVSLAEVLQAHPDVSWTHAARADFDLDGDLDVILVGLGPVSAELAALGKRTAGSPALHVVLLRNLGDMVWLRRDHWLGDPKALRSIMPIDLDADGFEDLLLQPREEGTPILLKQVLGRRLMPMASHDGAKDSSWPKAYLSLMGALPGNGGRVSWFSWQRGGSSHLRSRERKVPHFLYPLLQGIKGNRNAIGAQLTTRAAPFYRRTFEIGIRHTGPEQTPLAIPLHYGKASHIGTLSVRWPDGARRDIPTPTANAPTIISPP